MTEQQFQELKQKLFYIYLVIFFMGLSLTIGINRVSDHQNEQITLLQQIATSVAPSK